MTSAPLHEILIADDDSGIRDMLTRAFAGDFRVITAADGSEALRFLERAKPAAVIVDEMMPGATGTQVLQRSKALFPDVPRVLMTASNDTERAMNAINEGEIHRFYAKPLRVMELRRSILDLVKRAINEEALRIELRTLRAVKEESQIQRAATRVVILSAAEGDAAKRGDRVQAAAKARGFHTSRVTESDDLAANLMRAPADVVVLVTGPGVDVAALSRLAQTVDEATSVVIADGPPNLVEAMLALEVGAVDYFAEPYPDEALLARRMERAASGPRATRDMRRLTFDLIIANRELGKARRRVEEEQVKLLDAIIRALEARDEYTAGHTDRVAAISVRCGQALGMLPEQLDVVRLGALLHDVGKIGVRDAVLLKPGRLTPDEFDIIKTHTTIGAKILGDVEQFQCIIPIVRGHHEKLDGTGYPDGLKAQQISLEVRVVSASDVLDALTSTRPYRRGSSPEEAFDIMSTGVGRHLDPVVCDALKQVHKEGRLIELLQPDATDGDLPAPYRE